MDLPHFICLVFFTRLRPFAVGQIAACPSGQWQCDDGSCIPDFWRCDGGGDCLDGSDEMDCEGSPACPWGHFSCVDSMNCVDLSARCDGKKDCPTGYDEEDCEHISGCLDSDWTCHNKECISKELRCNGQKDCVDNSDEQDCGQCSGGIRCPEGTCLPPEKRCDGTVDCTDGRDEPVTCGHICSIKNGGCSHKCEDKPWGALCSCPVGYELSVDGAVCKDVDECSLPFAPCMHFCTNTVGSYYCHCREGFTLTGDFKCLATGNVTRLVTLQKTSLGLLDVRSRHFQVLQLAVLKPVALTFDLARSLYYWADERGNIHKTNGKQTSTIFTGQPGINSLACDWLNRQIYWTNQNSKAIYMQVADGKSYTTVLSKNINPSDLVLLPVESLMFWIDTGAGDRVTLEKSWMDGSDRSSLAVLTAQAAHGLTADVAARRLYWISDTKKSIETVKVDGSGHYSFSRVFNQSPALSLAVFEQFFYWTDAKGLWQAPLTASTQRKLIWKDPLPFISVYHELQQPQDPSSCSLARCDICLLTKGNSMGFTCTCPNSKVLLPNGICEYPRFVYGTFNSVSFLEFKDREVTEVQLFTTDEGILSFDVDWYRDWFYWANQTGHVKRTSLTQDRTEIIPTPLPACLLKVDQRSGNMYWVSCDQKSISVITTDGRYTQKLYDTQKDIGDLYLDWLRGGVLWLEEDSVYTMSMIGGKPVMLLRLGGGVVRTVAFDIRANSLLWNSKPAGLVTMSLFWERSHIVGKRWNITGSVVFALEPYLLSLSGNTLTLWDRRDGRAVKSTTVPSNVLSVIGALKDLHTDATEQSLSPSSLPSTPPTSTSPPCNSPSMLCPQSPVFLCISSGQICNGVKDCPDGFDEKNCVKRCTSKTDFRCKDRRSCVSQSQVCDGRAHCFDGSDEVNCPTLAAPTTRPNVLKCRVGSRLCGDGTECVLFSHVCDGERDCKDGSDEDDCDSSDPSVESLGENRMLIEPPPPTQPFTAAPTTPSCVSPSVLCPGSSVCILQTQFCDGKKDCPNASDEKCVKRCPSMTDFRCKDRRSCVSQSQVCDGRAHCFDGSDEVNCPTLAAPTTRPDVLKCRIGSRLCVDGTECVLFSHVCDGERDCRDGSDEEDCDSTDPSVESLGENRMLIEPPPPTQPFTAAPTTPSCVSPSILCPGSSVCILQTQFCDGKKDCPDASDEKCVKRCPSRTDFRCKDRRSCVSQSQVCDGRAHCFDGSDEVNCPTLAAPTTRPNVLKCRIGSRLCGDGTECVLFSHVCDGERDCKDGSDEEDCDSTDPSVESLGENRMLIEPPPPTQPFTAAPTTPSCVSPSILCPGSSVCILQTQFCDGKKDCPDASDEKCVKRCPSRTDFRCKDRRSCVSQSQVCDGRAHCFDGSDEVNCPTLAAPTTRPNVLKCRIGSRLCGDGTECVLFSHVCDGEKDCKDGSDEEDCDVVETTTRSQQSTTNPSTQSSTKSLCRSPSVLCPGSSVCILQTQFCDGRKDCPDASDEKCVKRCPSMADFRCKDRRSCVSQSQVCDGRAHCFDGSDEVNCPTLAAPTTRPDVLKCRIGSRLCGDGTECVLFSHVCDGERDCKDGSDEVECNAVESTTENLEENPRLRKPIIPTAPFTSAPTTMSCVSPSFFQCKDQKGCLSKSQVCDGRAHCFDGSDEVNCPTLAAPTTRPIVPQCRVGSRLCGDGTECVLFSHVCDGERDCQDGSDEEYCDDTEIVDSVDDSLLAESTSVESLKWSCASPSMLCPESSVCILPTQFCDGKIDCPDGSDENCETRCPDMNDFLCKDYLSCVPKSLVCNGLNDCRDGSDEMNCPAVAPPAAPSEGLQCPQGSKPCDNLVKCVLLSHLCDGEEDCQDGSDELGCPKTCKQGDFQCAHGKMCIPMSQMCDGKIHCLDHSDEINCREQTKSCDFHCGDGKRCLPKKFLCDGERDCEDGTDEFGCDNEVTSPTPVSTFPACTAPSVLCPGSAVCVSQSQLCDGQKDCPDGFDEESCIRRCEYPGDFLCRDRRKCIPQKEVCDGRANCYDGSDEKMCEFSTPFSPSTATSAPLRCRLGSKLCKDGLECVMYSHVCDGEMDCKDGSDEEGCAAECKAEEFQCAHGKKCILKAQVCDGQNDCQDRSDEVNCRSLPEGCHRWCDNNTRCIPDTFLCDGERDCADGSDEEKCGLVSCASNQFRCRSGQCVSEALRCDGYADCSDRSDEKSCSRPPRCLTQLRCPNSHECLQKEWICDGENDCIDGADEKNCKTPPAKCREYQWQCGDSSQCIPLSWRCDGKEDCLNGKDEDRCSERKCPPHLYKCGSGECLEPRLVCNRVTNCADRSDEGAGCALRNCSSSSARRCDHNCVSTPNGPRCFCAAGFHLQSSGETCVDVDECNTMAAGVCKHICLNTRGSFICHCHPGFYLEPDNRSCKTQDEPLLLASVQSEMLIFGVHSTTMRVMYSASRPVFSLDYHWAKNRIYWLSSNYQSIRWADINNKNNRGTLIKGVKSDFIAVDWVGQNLYWVDGLLGQILAGKLSDVTVKSQDYTVVLGEDLEQPSSLVLVSHKGLMFWSEIGSTPQIERAGMDGSRRQVVVSRGLSWPVSLAFDLLDNRIYWADEKLRCIGSASLDGENVKILQLAETPSPFSVAVFNDRVFWSDTKKRSIRSADKRTGKDQKVLVKRPGQPFGIKIMHALSQPSISNPCDQLPCSHLCLVAPAVKGQGAAADSTKGLTAVCRCPKGLLLSKDKLKCTVPMESTFLMLLSLQTVYQIHLHSMYHEGVGLKKMPNGRILALPGVNEASAMDASITGLSLYVADANQATVEVLKLGDSRSRQGLIPDGQILNLSKDDAVTAMAVDWVTSNLYWSSTKRPNLHVTSVKGHTTSLLPGSMKGTTSIALHPPSGLLCYTEVGLSGSTQSEVSCAWMDGRKKTVLWRRSSVPTSIVFSDKGTVIFWTDTGEGVINSIGVDGSGFKQYKTGPEFLISFTFVENFLLWVTLDKDVTRLWFSDGHQPKQLWFETKISLIELKAYSNTTQSGSNSCSNNNGGCAHLCLPYPGGSTCRCGQGYYTVNVTSCSPFPSCPIEKQSCPDGSKCISSSQFCDGHVDCQDGSDEQDCPYTDMASSGTKNNKDTAVKSLSSSSNAEKKSVEASCDLHCNAHGSCVTEGTVDRCQCVEGYKGEFCEEAVTGHSRGAVVLGLFCLVALLIAAGVLYVKRRELALAFSRTREKETLMSNIGLPLEHCESENEELDSSVDGKSPGLTLESLQLTQ